MSERNPMPIVVAVGDDTVDSALVFAAQEAASFGCGLHLVHVVHRFVHGPDDLLVEVTDQTLMGKQLLNVVLERARDIVGDETPVTADLLLGSVVPSLVEAAHDARLIVLEHRDLSPARRVVTRSVTSGVAAHARLPVVSVPAQWSPAALGAATRRVAVGVEDPDRCEHVLLTGLTAAGRRGATLHIVHTWSFPSAYDDIVMSQAEEAEWAARAEREIRAVLDGFGDEIAGTPVEIEARHARPADALIEASRSADLLVVGRHDPKTPLGSHLGPVARAVLHASAAPVLLADLVP